MRFAVVGDPVGHSRSPAIHRAAFAAAGVNATYEAIEVASGAFTRVSAMIEQGDLDGVNVTMPLKTEAFVACSTLSPEASASGAVNTVTRPNGSLQGDNTDVDGVEHSVGRLHMAKEPPVLVLGGGGAARAACVALRGRDLAIAARRPGVGADVLARTGVDGEELPWGRHVPGAIVVNATPLGMRGETLPERILDDASGLVDMVYGEHATPAVEAARRRGIPVSDGIDMLVGQAARAFEILVGLPAPVDVMERAARA